MEISSVNSGQKFLHQIIMDAPYGVLVINNPGKIILSNNLAKEYFLIDKDDIVGSHVNNYIKSVPELIELIDQLRLGIRDHFDVMELVFNNRIITVRGRRTGDWSIVTVQDITQWKELEISGLRAMMEGQEIERRRMAKEIHDGVGPELSSVLMNLEAIKMDAQGNSDIYDRVTMLTSMISEVSDELRAISHALMPRVLIDFGLAAAVQGVVERINKSRRINVEFIENVENSRLESDIELNLFRITQELISNSLKHAEASRITIQLIQSNKKLSLTVEDDGKGISPSLLESTDGIGLNNVDIRTKMIGGFFNLDSSPDRGVIATIEVELK